MSWNWELPGWPAFTYDPEPIMQRERKFLLGVGSAFAFLKKIDEKEHNQFIVEILSVEGQQSSKIERLARAQSHPFRGGLSKLSILSGAEERPPLNGRQCQNRMLLRQIQKNF